MNGRRLVTDSSGPQGLAEAVSSKELAALVGEPHHTIDYWSDQGLLQFTKRGRRRRYDPEVNRVLCVRIRELQQEGMSLATMHQIFAGEQPGQSHRSS